jgi:hypothetical protein
MTLYAWGLTVLVLPKRPFHSTEKDSHAFIEKRPMPIHARAVARGRTNSIILLAAV